LIVHLFPNQEIERRMCINDKRHIRKNSAPLDLLSHVFPHTTPLIRITKTQVQLGYFRELHRPDLVGVDKA